MGNPSPEALLHAGTYRLKLEDAPAVIQRPTPETPSPEHPMIVSTANTIREQFFQIVNRLREKDILPLGPYKEEGIIFIETGNYTTPSGEVGADMTVIDANAKTPAEIIKTVRVHETGDDGRWDFAGRTLTLAKDKHVIRHSIALLGKVHRLLTIEAIKAEQKNETAVLAQIRKALASKGDNEEILNNTLASAIEWLIPMSVDN
jgi:hypothetical protein